jgi:hypothetical protein
MSFGRDFGENKCKNILTPKKCMCQNYCLAQLTAR